MLLDSGLVVALNHNATTSVALNIVKTNWDTNEISTEGVDYNYTVDGVSEGQLVSIVNGTQVAVYTDNVQNITGPTEPGFIANDIKNKTDADVVIVYIEGSGFQPFAVAGDTSDGQIMKTLQAEGLLAGTETAVSVSEQPAMGSDGGFDLIPVGGGILGVAVLATAGALGFRALMKKNKSKAVTTSTGSVQVQIQSGMPEKIRPLLDQLNKTIRLHHNNVNAIQEAYQMNGHNAPSDLEKLMSSIVANIQQLFIRLEKKGSSEKKRIVIVEYEDKLTKLLDGLGDNYYLDIANNPTLWDNPVERMNEVYAAVEQVNMQLVENIKQVNASKDLEFRYVLNALTAPKNNPNVKDIYKNNQGEN